MLLPTVAILLVLASGRVSATGCPNGFITNGTSCYLFSVLRLSWIQAMKICVVHGGELVTVDSAAEEEFLEDYLHHTWTKANQSDGIWLGATDLLVENEWIWAVSNRPVQDYLRWAPGEPNSINSHGEDCMDILPHKGFLWNDENCATHLNFVCERSLLAGYIPPGIIG